MIHIRDQKFRFWFYEKLFYSSLKWLQEHDREYLDIPEEVISLNNYRASLGHKINHSFQPNCKWDQMMHPTFGRIPSVITLLDLKAGTELTCHYMIDMQEAAGIDHLQWYLDHQFLENCLLKSDKTKNIPDHLFLDD